MPAEYGLIGYPLGHSFSPTYFAKKFSVLNIDAVYKAYPLDNIAEYPALINTHSFKGLNVTIPYKEAIISYLDTLDPVAEKVGAVNTILFKDETTKGFNTDVIGFENSVRPLLASQHKQALILGTGGASKAVAYVLETLGISYSKVSRTKTENVFSYEELNDDIIAHHTLIINCSPVGKSPAIDDAPVIPYAGISVKHLVYDLIYNPAETKLLKLAKEQGARVKNGLEMLERQADAAWEIWNS